MSARARRWVLLTFATLILLWSASGLVVDLLLTRRRTHFTEPLPAELVAADPPCVELRLRASDGLALGAWWIPARDARRAALVLHGNDGSRTENAGLASMLRDDGTSVLALTLRAHGDSEGERNDLGYSARRDVLAALDEVARRAPGLPIVVVGRSLGAAAALYAAEEAKGRVDGWVLEAPYKDLESAVRARLAMFLPAGFDRVAWATMRLSAPLVLEPPLDALAPIAHATALAGEPVLVLAGERDRHAPSPETREFATRIGASAEFVEFPGREHVQLARSDPERYLAAYRRLVARIDGSERVRR
ncbi:MAG: alpha/beta fold hydrolase [Planctomycetes bacterium]|nr:alpha/beta fold hydrolase [Planctomycetota bacterium]